MHIRQLSQNITNINQLINKKTKENDKKSFFRSVKGRRKYESILLIIKKNMCKLLYIKDNFRIRRRFNYAAFLLSTVIYK